MPIALALLAALVLVLLAAASWVLLLLHRQSAAFDGRLRDLEQRLATQRLLRGLRHAGGKGARMGPPAGSLLNDWELPDLRGGMATLSGLRGRRIAVVLVQPECPFSRAFVETIAATGSAVAPNGSHIVLIGNGTDAEHAAWLPGLPAGIPLLRQRGIEIGRVWRVPASPGGYLIDAHGVTETDSLAGCAELLTALGLDDRLAALPAALQSGITPLTPKTPLVPRPLPVGAQAPVETIPLHPAGELELRSPAGDHTLIVFSDPACDPCRALRAALDQPRVLPPGLRLVVVERGGDPSRPARYPRSIQTNARLALAFGMVDAPSALVIDAEGRVASPPAIGADPVLALLADAVTHAGARQMPAGTR